MEDTAHRAIAIVGVGAVLPEAPNVTAFWENIKTGRNCITEVRADRWDPAYYYDADHGAPDKTYSKIGGWVREFPWEPMKWRLPIPPRVAEAMDDGQQWALACTREALEDYGYPNRPLNLDRTAVILGNAMGGERHYMTALRVYYPEYAHELAHSDTFAALPAAMRADITRELRNRMNKRFPEINEDSMPGELANCLAGRVANTYNFHGPNFTADAACASTMAALSAAMNGLVHHDFDVVVAGGIDHNMGAPTFVKFCKIGALSATGTRPFAEGADGFVMGEGAALFLLKRLADAERDEDKIYAVLRGIGGSSDGKGKSITAPNPIGQKFAIERAWQNAGLSPATVTMIEGHGTSTKVGDVVEVQSMVDALAPFNLPPASVALGSVKSNIGHLKAAAAAAGLLKATLALRDKVLAPSVNCTRTNPDIDFAHSSLYVNTELRPWTVPQDGVRRAGLSAFGFGGTNFHLVLEEYIPHRINGNGKRAVSVGASQISTYQSATGNPAACAVNAVVSAPVAPSCKVPLRGALVIGANSSAGLAERLQKVQQAAAAGQAPAPTAPAEADLRSPERLAIDYADAAELADKAAKALKALAAEQPPIWKALRAQGIHRGHGPAPKVAFLYTGQGSQYVNMVQALRAAEPIVAETFAEADRALTNLLAKPLSEYIFIDGADPDAVAKAEDDLRQTAITQPAVIATDVAITRLLVAYGIQPDMAMGHSVGEYGALVATGGLPFEDAMEAVSARGREMTVVSFGDNGGMAAVFAPLGEIERILKTIDGYVVIANVNSKSQAVIGGESKALAQAMEAFLKAGFNAVQLPVSHAFHTSIVAGASEPLKRMLERLRLRSPKLPTVANLDGEFYPTGPDGKQQMVEMLAKQVASPVQFVKGLETLYQAGARVFIETGPKKALQGFAEDVLGEYGDVLSLFTNHPKFGDIMAFNQALCGLYSAGLGSGQVEAGHEITAGADLAQPAPSTSSVNTQPPPPVASTTARNPERGFAARPTKPSIVITGAALGLPGTERIFDDANIGRILQGEQFIDVIPTGIRRAMLDKHITRLVKSDNGGAFETISSLNDVIKLAGRGGAFDVVAEFGVSTERSAALDRVTSLAIAAGIDALRDAGIPLVMHYKTTSKGTQLPDGWRLPDDLRDDTGVIFASAFPGLDFFAGELSRYHADRARREQLAMLEGLHARMTEASGHAILTQEINHCIDDVRDAIEKYPYTFDRRFLFKALSMGHSQFAEFIGARGPNTQINGACASTPQAVAIAEDWISAGRCRRVIIISADDVTTDNLLEWMGAGFLASGAAATDEVVEDAATPFDRRRHGMVVGMGAAALVVESADAVEERGIQPICEVLSTVTANSAFHGTRLDVQHISKMMEDLVSQAEARSGIARREIAPQTVFVSHETYTPARGGSAAAEIHALRHVFGDTADQIVIANTKGFTGHAMGTGIEDVIAVKALETGYVPPVPNFKEVDPELGPLNLSKGGIYPVEYALRLAAGFGSQLSMTLLRWVATKDRVHCSQNALGYAYRVVDEEAWKAWLSRVAGSPAADLEVVQRTLRVHNGHAAASVPVAVEDSNPIPTVQAVPCQPIAAPQPEPAIPSQSSDVAPSSPKAPPVAPAPSVTPNALLTDDSVKERVLALVANITGYPIDMLDLDLDLEADLGVDTVKQAEVFATIREAYGIARDDNIRLRDFPTISHVIRFVYERRADLGAPLPIPAATEVKATAPDVKESNLNVPEPAEPILVTSDSHPVKERILALVVEKTGYPKDMLDLDLDLEADLGVDTVKQAEMIAAIRELYNIPLDQNLKLRDYPTLSHVIRFVYEKRPDLAGAISSPPAAASVPVPSSAVASTPTASVPVPSAAAIAATAAPAQEAISDESIKEKVLEIVAQKTGYPKDMLDLDLDLEADLGVDTVKQAEMIAAIRELYNIPLDQNLKLRDYPTLSHVIRFVHEKRPDLAGAISSPPAPTASVPILSQVAIAAPSAPAEEAITDESIKEKVLEIVAQKTGYPKDMLDLDLDLEADLGVDTVKQAEMIAAIREIYNIPLDQNLKLRDYPTLSHVIRFVHEKRPDLAGAISSPPAPTASVPIPSQAATAAPAQEAITDESIKEKVLEIVAQKTGYPKDMLDLDLDLEADLGVDTVKQAEMIAAIRELYNIPLDQNLKLRDYPTLSHVIRFVHEKRPDLAGAISSPPAPTASVPIPSQAATAAPAQEAITDESVKEKVLEIVAQKTGYPKDMLDLDLDLEADLGVDTVKQAEMIAAIRELYNIPLDQNLKLRDYPTLSHVIRFVHEKRPDLAGAISSSSSSPALPQKAVEAGAAPQSAPSPARPRPPLASFDAANRIPRRVPVPVLRPEIKLCKPTGVTLAPGSRVVMMPDKGGVANALTQRLQTLGVEVLRIEGAPDTDAILKSLYSWLATGPIQGVYWLPALDHEGALLDMDLAGWREALRIRLKALFMTMRALYEQIAGSGTFLVSATRLGGQHGYDAAGAVAPLGGPVVGMTKTYKRERGEVLVKAVDFELSRNAAELAETLIEETLYDPGAVEIGYKQAARWTVALEERPAVDGQPGLTLDNQRVFVITGAAGSIVSAITSDLASASGGIFYLLDMVPEPDPANPDLVRFVSDKEGLKRDLFARIQARGERATPALVEKELVVLERAQAALSAINAVRAAGGTPHYFSVNLTNADAVAEVIGQVRQRSGRIDVLLHAAGMERSHFLPDKDPREFDLIFDVKSDGWFNLLRAIGDMPLAATVAFSSIAGRFGNGGQADYSSANDLLCKITSSFRTTRPATRGIAIDWTAWGGIGMATRGSIPKMMELAGIDMLPPEAGIPLIRRELTSGATRGEILIGQRLGILLHEFDANGGLNVNAVAASIEARSPAPGPMIGRVASMVVHTGLTVETMLDPARQAFLHDHQIGGTPVLPGVMGIEAFAEAALVMLPGYRVEAVEDVSFLAPFKFYRNQPREVTVQTVISQQGSAVLADCRLIGRRTLAKQEQPEVTTHFTGRVRLTRQASVEVAALQFAGPKGSILEAADIYRIYFHGPAYRVLGRAWLDGNRVVGRMAENLPQHHYPITRPVLLAPRLIELCFQTAGLWEITAEGRMGLPRHVDRVCLWREPELASGPLYALVTPASEPGSFDAEVVDAAGNRYLQMSGYKTVALPDRVDSGLLKALHAIA